MHYCQKNSRTIDNTVVDHVTYNSLPRLYYIHDKEGTTHQCWNKFTKCHCYDWQFERKNEFR